MRTLALLFVVWLGGCSSEATLLDHAYPAKNSHAEQLPPSAGTQDLACMASGESLPYLEERNDRARSICGADAPAMVSADQLGLLPGGADPNVGLSAPREVGEVCLARIRTLLATPGLPGAPGLEARRTRVLAYTKAEPVLFTQTPSFERESSTVARSYQAMLKRSASPWSLIEKLIPVFSQNPRLGRAVLLRQGYLYAETPELGFALVDRVKAHHLFDAPNLWIQRGEQTLFAQRTSYGHYLYLDGPQRGQRVRLLLFDRIGAGEMPAPLHRDLRSLRRRLGFDRARVQQITEEGMLVDLRYGTVWIPTVLRSRGARLELECELLSSDLMPRVTSFRSRQARAERVLFALRRAMLTGVEEGLPFDEPLTEYGQQDGQLRRFWLRAYQEGRASYEINGDRYKTFDPHGRALIPQVCVDFVFDTLERASGTWWRSRGEPPGRVVGKLDFGTLSDETRRRASSFIELARTRTDWFDTWEIPEQERISLKKSSALALYLTRHADDFVSGDVVLIRGYAPWDKPWRPRVMHYHSFFVYETDPVTGFPAMLVGNPGRPLLQTWQFEAFRTPDRSIWYRMRPRLEWLEEVIEPNVAEEADFSNPPLAAGPG